MLSKKSGIFISYSHADKNFARKISLDLMSYGVSVWFDEGEMKIGDHLIDKISSGINEMDYLAVILSPDSVESHWVKTELRMALHQEIISEKVKVLPIYYRKCEIPLFLKTKMFADFSDENKYGESINLILDSIGLNRNKLSFKGYDLKILKRIQEIYIEDVKGILTKLGTSGKWDFL